MDKLLITIVFGFISGCALFNAYTMAKFDANEYHLATSISSRAEISAVDCDDRLLMKTNAAELLYTATEFKNYAANIPHNEESINMSEALLKEVQGLSARYKTEEVSTYYCTTKMQIIERSAKIIQTTLGAKPR